MNAKDNVISAMNRVSNTSDGWMVAVWSVRDGRIKLVERTTEKFPSGDFLTTVMQLAASLVDEKVRLASAGNPLPNDPLPLAVLGAAGFKPTKPLDKSVDCALPRLVAGSSDSGHCRPDQESESEAVEEINLQSIDDGPALPSGPETQVDQTLEEVKSIIQPIDDGPALAVVHEANENGGDDVSKD